MNVFMDNRRTYDLPIQVVGDFDHMVCIASADWPPHSDFDFEYYWITHYNYHRETLDQLYRRFNPQHGGLQ